MDFETIIKEMIFPSDQSPGYLASCLMLLNGDGTKFNRCIAHNFDSEFTESLIDAPIGPTGTTSSVCVYRKESVYVSHILEDPSEWIDLSSTWFGIWAAWSMVVSDSVGRILGAFTMYFSTPRCPTKEEKDRMGRVSKLAAFAISHAK